MGSLAHSARSAVLWTTGFNLFRDLLQFGSMLVLTRLLAPESYGKFSLTNSIIGFLTLFSIGNFIGHALQVKSEADTRFQEHFTAGAVLQGFLFLLANIVATALRWIPAYASVAPLVHVMSITFLLEWPCELRRKMLERELNWKRLNLLHGAGLLASTALAVVLAWLGAGAYALLVPGALVTVPFILDLVVKMRWKPNWSWSREAYGPAWRFGLARLGSGLAGSSRQLLESGAMSAMIGFAGLGIVSRSFALATMFCQRFAAQLLYSIYPVLARVEDQDGRSMRIGNLVLRVVTWTVIPTGLVLAVLAEPVVRVTYGSRWAAVVPMLPWTVVWGALSAAAHASYMLLLARQRARLCLASDLGVLLGTLLALLLVLPTGTSRYLMVVALIQGGSLVFLSAALVRVGAASAPGLIAAVMPPSMSAGLAWAALTTVGRACRWEAPSTFWVALAWGSSFGVLYVAILRLAFRRQMLELVSYFPANQALRKCLLLGPAP